jgi:hypothetical protein
MMCVLHPAHRHPIEEGGRGCCLALEQGDRNPRLASRKVNCRLARKVNTAFNLAAARVNNFFSFCLV